MTTENKNGAESEEKVTPTESPTENKPTEDTQPEEGEHTPTPKDKDIPWHKDPRWKAWQEEKENLASQLQRLNAWKQEYEPIINNIKPKEDISVPAWFGGDESSYRMYLADQENLFNRAKQSALSDYEEKQRQYNERVQKATDYMNNVIADIESTGEKVSRNKLQKIVEDEQLIDTKGNWNYKAGFELLKARELLKQNPSNAAARKKIADLTPDKNSAEPSKKMFSQDDFKGRGWNI